MIDSTLKLNNLTRGFEVRVRICEDYEVFHNHKHNMYYYDEVRKSLSSSGSTLFVHLTGAGKSYVALQCILYFVRESKISSVVVLGSNKGVLYTWEKLFSSNSGKMAEALPLAVTEETNNAGEVYESTGTVSHKFTNSDGNTETLKFNYDVLTYAAALNKGGSLAKSKTLYILDEPHHLADEENKWNSIIDAIASADYILGLTATSTVPSGETGKLFATKVNGMRLSDLDGFNDMNVSYINYKDDDPSNPPVERRDPIMPKLEIFHLPVGFNTTGTSYAEFAHTIDVLSKLDTGAEYNFTRIKAKLKSLFSKENMANYIQSIFSRTPRKLVVAASSKDFKSSKTSELVSTLTGISPSNIFVVSSSTPDGERNKIFSLFKDKSQEVALINYEVVSEGVHLEGVNGVLILGHTSSSRKYIQTIGRILSADFRNQMVPVVDLTTSLYDMYKTYVDDVSSGRDPRADIDDLNFLLKNISFVAYSPDFPDCPAKEALQEYTSAAYQVLINYRKSRVGS